MRVTISLFVLVCGIILGTDTGVELLHTVGMKIYSKEPVVTIEPLREEPKPLHTLPITEQHAHHTF